MSRLRRTIWSRRHCAQRPDLLAAATFAIGVACACGGGPTKETPAAPLAAESPVAVIEKWRAKHETDYRRDWVTIAGLHALKPGPNTAGSATTNDIVLPRRRRRRWAASSRQATSVRFEPAPSALVTASQRSARDRAVDLRDDRTPIGR